MNAGFSQLLKIISAHSRICVALSGGTDSALLLYAAVRALGAENVIAVTAVSPLMPHNDKNDADALCERLGVRHMIYTFDPFSVEGFCGNPPDRCYICKKALFGGIIGAAAEQGFPVVAEGTNADDVSDYRPGMRALEELGVLSPLREAGLTKAEIRELSAYFSLPTADKPAGACLATRINTGDEITKNRLALAGGAEEILHGLGFAASRVRLGFLNNGTVARIEVSPEDMPGIVGEENRHAITGGLKKLGFKYVTLDLEGYRHEHALSIDPSSA
ncbi:MAG: ATP-dependent sacrificial sulfur transferase LarE [Clostridia bacterium]|nr:ATP-dependent sacrificial sulfur transferase LarE [Clostridia bacterium]